MNKWTKPSRSAVAGACLSLSMTIVQSPANAQADKPAQGLDLQHARAKFVVVKAKKVFYTKRWDLSGLPSYHPQTQVSGSLRIWGSNYIQDGNVGRYWEEGFRKYQPKVHFDFPNADDCGGGTVARIRRGRYRSRAQNHICRATII